MALVDLAFVNRSNREALEIYARQYWLGEHTVKSITEVLVRKAIIAEVLSKSEQERRAYFKSWAISPSIPGPLNNTDAPR